MTSMLKIYSFSIWWIGNIIQHVVYLFCWLFIWTGDGDADWGGIRGTSASDRTIYLFPTSSTCRLSARIRGTRTFRMFQQIQTWSCKRILVWCSCKICICGNFRMALFGEYAWDGWAALPYSLVYNGCYIFAEAALTVLVLSIPAVSKAMKKVKITAVN